MGARVSKPQEAQNATSRAGASFRVLYKMNSEETAIRLGNIRMIVGYDDFMIQHLLWKLDFSTKLGVKLLSELKRLDEEIVAIIRILTKRLVDRNDLYELVKKVEETCGAIRDFLFSLQVCASLPRAGDDCHEKASKVLKAIEERREQLLRLRVSLFPARTEVGAKIKRPRGCMQPLLTAIMGRKRQGPARQRLKVTGIQTGSTPQSSARGRTTAMLHVQHPAASRGRTPLLGGWLVRNAIIYERQLPGGLLQHDVRDPSPHQHRHELGRCPCADRLGQRISKICLRRRCLAEVGLWEG
jgi:hypothetical protein